MDELKLMLENTAMTVIRILPFCFFYKKINVAVNVKNGFTPIEYVLTFNAMLLQ